VLPPFEPEPPLLLVLPPFEPEPPLLPELPLERSPPPPLEPEPPLEVPPLPELEPEADALELPDDVEVPDDPPSWPENPPPGAPALEHALLTAAKAMQRQAATTGLACDSIVPSSIEHLVGVVVPTVGRDRSRTRYYRKEHDQAP
jgi:hypothetical protein